MKDDLGPAERRWRQRSLFRPVRRRRRWPWLLLLFVLIVVGLLLLQGRLPYPF